MIRILIAENNTISRLGIVSLLKQADGIVIEASVETGQEALEKVRILKPKVVLLDCNLKNASAISVATRIQQYKASTHVLALSDDTNDALIQAMFKAGVSGYLLKKDMNRERLVKAIQTVALEERWLVPFISCKPFHNLDQQSSSTEEFTTREFEILHLLAQGCCNREIADQLSLKLQSVKNYICRIYAKLEVNTRLQAIQKAQKRIQRSG